MDKTERIKNFVSSLRSQVSGFIIKLVTCNLRLVTKACFLLLFIFFILNSLGCATYKFQRGKPPYDTGYVAARDDYTILEYTVGKENSLPSNVTLAKERLKRRHRIVEHHYKKMGHIDNHFKMTFWNPCIYTAKTMKGIFRLPFVAISDYRYEHNPKYRERIIKREAEEDSREEAYIQGLKEELDKYIQKDIAAEGEAGEFTKVKKERPVKPVKEAAVKEAAAKEEPQIRLKKTIKTVSSSAESARQPIAVIIARPAKGFSPLTVRFYGFKSRVENGKIVSYHWDFGDGDTSAKINPANTYYSGSFAPQRFAVTLTVRDDQGNTARAATTIEVLNK